jgi:ribosomal protein S18 acetylase RimI-like enzyme
MDPRVRIATSADAPAVGELLDRFNRDFNDFTPGPAAMAQRITELIAGHDTMVLLAEEPPAGLAVLRLRPALWTQGLECYLAELYVVPERRRRGLGRAIMLGAIATAKSRGAASMDLGTDEGDHAAHALYKSLGFRNTGARGEVSYVFELDL